MSYWRLGEPVKTVNSEDGVPQRFTWQGQVHPVKTIANVWRIDDGWWQQRIWRDYFKLVTATGLLVIICHDLLTDEWHLIRIYD